MAKNITIGVLSSLIVFFVLLARIRTREAEVQTILAEYNLQLARESEAKAKAEEQKAVEAAALALIEQKKAEELQKQLDDCKN